MSSPTIPVAVGLSPEAAALLLPYSAKIEERIGDVVAGVAGGLGIPGTPSVALTRNDDEVALISLTVNGRRCRAVEDSFALSFHFAVGTMPRLDTTSASVIAELRTGTDAATAARFVAGWCYRVLERQPAVLFDRPQAEAYAQAMAVHMGVEATAGPDGDHEAALLRRLLSLRISIADVATVADAAAGVGVAEVADAAPGVGVADELRFERLVDSLRPKSLDLCCHPDFLRRVTLALDVGEGGLLTFARNGLFRELGITLPDFRFVAEADLPAGCFNFQLNHLPTAPSSALPPGTILVGEPPDRVGDGIDAQPTVNPANGRLVSVAPAEHQQALDVAGTTTWDDAGFLVLTLAAAVRDHAQCFVTATSTREMLEALRPVYPILVDTLGSLVSDASLTSFLRDLVSGGVSISNLPLILNRLVEIETGDSHPPRLESVRQSLSRQTTERVAQGSTVVCHRVSPVFERKLVEASAGWEPWVPPVGSVVDLFQDAYRSTLASLVAAAPPPVVLTTDGARSAVAEALRHAFPRTVVVAYGDLDPGTNVQVLASIS